MQVGDSLPIIREEQRQLLITYVRCVIRAKP